MFLAITTINDQTVIVNPNHIVSILPHKTEEGYTTFYMSTGLTYHSKSHIEDVMYMLKKKDVLETIKVKED